MTSCTTQIESEQEQGNVVVSVVRQIVEGTAHHRHVEVDAGKRDVWADGRGGLEQTSTTSLWQDIYVNGRLRRRSGTPPSPSPSP